MFQPSSRPPRSTPDSRDPKFLDLWEALRLAWECKAPIRICPAGSSRALADLRLCAIAPGREWTLGGAKSRDRLPAEGSLLQAAIRLGGRIFTFPARCLGCRWEPGEGNGARPVIRLEWPESGPRLGAVEEAPAAPWGPARPGGAKSESRAGARTKTPPDAG